MPQTSVPDAGSSGIEPSRSKSPPFFDENMPSDDEDSETVRKALLQSSGPETADAGILNPRPNEIAPNAPIGDIDTSMHSPSAGEAPLPTSSVESQPNTASAALQRIHDYIDSQLTDLVGMAVERAVGASYNKLADSINKEIVSIRNQVFQSTPDEDDPMSRDQPNDNPADGDD